MFTTGCLYAALGSVLPWGLWSLAGLSKCLVVSDFLPFQMRAMNYLAPWDKVARGFLSGNIFKIRSLGGHLKAEGSGRCFVLKQFRVGSPSS